MSVVSHPTGRPTVAVIHYRDRPNLSPVATSAWVAELTRIVVAYRVFFCAVPDNRHAPTTWVGNCRFCSTSGPHQALGPARKSGSYGSGKMGIRCDSRLPISPAFGGADGSFPASASRSGPAR